jgi:CDP-paratose 2-epimerase
MTSTPERRVLVTGGAGFVGANLAIALAEHHRDWEVVAFDNLMRRGSELNLARLRAAGVRFEHGDVRISADLARLPRVDALIESSAEPSVVAGFEDPDKVVRTNLVGAWNCLELARRDGAQLVFLSTSRVYPVAHLAALAFRETPTRFELVERQPLSGASPAGISEDFPLDGARTMYGASKLAAELLIEECRAGFGLRAVVNRCGVIAGPWQMGRVDQGVFAHWLIAHRFGRPLRYIGFGGSGRQVRDLLHIADLVELVADQIERSEHWDGVVANVGGGAEGSLSLVETTAVCQELSGREVPITRVREGRPGDVPIYISDCARLFGHTTWRPRRMPSEVLADTWKWICEHESALQAALQGP